MFILFISVSPADSTLTNQSEDLLKEVSDRLKDNPDSFQEQPENLDNCLEKIIKKEPPEKSAKPSTSKPVSTSSNKTSSSVSNTKISRTSRAKVKPTNDDDDDSSSSSSKASSSSSKSSNKSEENKGGSKTSCTSKKDQKASEAKKYESDSDEEPIKPVLANKYKRQRSRSRKEDSDSKIVPIYDSKSIEKTDWSAAKVILEKLLPPPNSMTAKVDDLNASIEQWVLDNPSGSDLHDDHDEEVANENDEAVNAEHDVEMDDDDVICIGNFSQTPEVIEIDDDNEQDSLMSSQQMILDKIKDEPMNENDDEDSSDEKQSDVPSDEPENVANLDDVSSGSDDEDLSASQQALFKKMNKQIKKEKHEEEIERRSKSFADIGYDDFEDDLDMPMEVNEEKMKPKTFEDILSEEDFSIESNVEKEKSKPTSKLSKKRRLSDDDVERLLFSDVSDEEENRLEDAIVISSDSAVEEGEVLSPPPPPPRESKDSTEQKRKDSEASREPLKKKPKLSTDEVRKLVEDDSNTDKVAVAGPRKLLMIDPLPQPHRKAYQRGISSETIEKLTNKDPVPSTSKTLSSKPSTSKDQWLSKSNKKKSEKEKREEREREEKEDRKAKRKAKLEELAKNQQEKKSDDKAPDKKADEASTSEPHEPHAAASERSQRRPTPPPTKMPSKTANAAKVKQSEPKTAKLIEFDLLPRNPTRKISKIKLKAANNAKPSTSDQNVPPPPPPQEPSSSSTDATKGHQKSKRRISWADQEHKKPLSEIRYIDVVGKGQPLPKDKRDMYGIPKGFTMNDVLRQIVDWNPKWLEEQKKQPKAPPVFGKFKLHRKTDVFVDFREYCNTLYPLMMLELWSSVFKDYCEGDENLLDNLPYMMYQGHEPVPNSKMIRLFFYSFITKKEKNKKSDYPGDGWLAIVPLNYHRNGHRVQEQVLGYITQSIVTPFKKFSGGGHMKEFEAMRPHIIDERKRNIEHYVKLEVTMKYIQEGALTDKPVTIKPISR